MADTTWKEFIELLPYYIEGSKAAECMRCGRVHEYFRFSPEQLYYMQAACYQLLCDNCGTRMHKPVEE